MLTGLNHLTLSVRELARSVAFYRDMLGLRQHARWDRGAYLSAGDLWLCLSLVGQDTAALASPAYTHYAFAISQQDFPALPRACAPPACPNGSPTAAPAIPCISSTRTATGWKPMRAAWRSACRRAARRRIRA